MALLEVRDLQAGALRGLSLSVDPAEIVALLGRNGAGKSTAARVVSGLHRPDSGSVSLHGREIARLPARQIVRLGLAHVSDGRRVFGSLTVEQNLIVAAHAHRRDRDLVRRRREHVYGVFPALGDLRARTAATLSGGEAQLLVIGRGLMTAPDLLVVDEPSSGLAPGAIGAVATALAEIRDAGTAVLLIEQHVPLALRVADRVLLLRDGRIAVDEPVGVAREDPRIRSLHV